MLRDQRRIRLRMVKRQKRRVPGAGVHSVQADPEFDEIGKLREYRSECWGVGSVGARLGQGNKVASARIRRARATRASHSDRGVGCSFGAPEQGRLIKIRRAIFSLL